MPTSPSHVPSPGPRRGWRRFLVTLKWCRLSVLLFLLVVIVLGLFLNHVGLPDWLNRRIEQQFRDEGWDLKYSRLRLRWYRGIVADDLQLSRTNVMEGPHLFAQSADFQLNWKAVRHFDLEANSASLSNGRLVWPMTGTNSPRRTLLLDRIGGQLLFRRDDFGERRFLETRVRGLHVYVRGEVTNAHFVRQWKLPARPRP